MAIDEMCQLRPPLRFRRDEQGCSHAEALGANAVVAVDLDYETIELGSGGGMLMVAASGTAVLLS